MKVQLRTVLALFLGCMLLILSACGGANGNSAGKAAAGNQGGQNAENAAPNQATGEELRSVKVVLDWSPNTNHTGLYVAKDQGYFAEEGLNVDILLPGSGGAEAMVASGEVPFGVSVQENVTQSRLQGVPLVSIAAIIQHNTSGFAAPVAKNIKTPKDFEGKAYGGWGSPVEEAVIKSIMDLQGADVGKVKFLNIGDADYFTAVKRDIDFAWIFYAWTGIEAELRGEPLDMLYVKDFSEQLDYYTPVLVTNEKTIKDDPELVKAFMRAVSKGYDYAIAHPEESAQILLKAVPELDKDLVVASQKWLSPKYKDDAPRWGEQKKEVWQNYSDWMHERGLLEKPLEVDAAFTNEFLPSE
ncbi:MULTISPECIES: ABC transporter substrate-binding protein [Paenibacillus]|uniref:ABC transporter substrate-binding protein n=1 Tax=Paenibacillus TaxID=44249 RepID=UPI001B03CE43|nr:ABC transporter substrate-binding protein [Paenibacillus sp. J53TS2]GIP49997.1 ABC transporter substrate-binding protein [Paenibacillus sp. J53TS2]